MKIASPIAYENDVIDFEFEFCDGQKILFLLSNDFGR